MPVTGTTIPLFRRGSWRTSLDVAEVSATIRIGIAPEILIVDDAKRVQAQVPRDPFRDVDARRKLLLDAIDVFRDGKLRIGDVVQDRAELHRQLRETAGLPPSLIDRWTAMLREYAARAIPAPAAFAAVSLPGNTFTSLEPVCDAILGGGVVWVRPSRKEPVAAARFVAALLAAGWPAERLGFYATEACVLHALVRHTDRQVLYGGEAVVRAFGNVPTATVHGPGGAVAIVGDDVEVEDAARRLSARVAGDSGRFCTNVRTIVCRGDAGALADALGAELDAIPLEQLASMPGRAAEEIAGSVLRSLLPGDAVVTKRALVQRENDATYLAPLLIHPEPVPQHPLVGRELPFPFATIVAGHAAFASAMARRPLHVETLGEGNA